MALPTSDQVFESKSDLACDLLKKTVAGKANGSFGSESSLYGPGGGRKYVNREERDRVLAAAEALEPEQCLFTLVLAWTGARVSEVLALSASSFQVDAGKVSIVTLKRRKLSVREVPISPELMERLDRHFGLRQLQQGEHSAQQRLWGCHRVTAWRLIKHVMTLAQVVGAQACPRGLRHGFGVGALHSGTPLHLIQKWMGHARLSTTAIYMDVCGPDELCFAERFWQNRSPSLQPGYRAAAYAY